MVMIIITITFIFRKQKVQLYDFFTSGKSAYALKLQVLSFKRIFLTKDFSVLFTKIIDGVCVMHKIS
jgi:hypothetical protein